MIISRLGMQGIRMGRRETGKYASFTIMISSATLDIRKNILEG